MSQKTVDSLSSTTFYGQRFTRQQLVGIQTTVKRFPNLSRRELGHTICEHLNWVTPTGQDKIQSCLGALKEMEAQGLITLPAIQVHQRRSGFKAIAHTDATQAAEAITGVLADLLPITVDVVTEKNEITRWNEWVDRYHYLGYKKPRGPHLRYYIVDARGRELGCALFAFATCDLACRDEWIGWDKRAQKKRLHLVINNNRFLIFPWVNVLHLASKSLSLLCRHIGPDWETHHGYRPILLETFVDTTHYKGTCYRAANWQSIGETAGRHSVGQAPKATYVYPLRKDFRAVLMKGEAKNPRQRTSQHPTKISAVSDKPVIDWWQKVMTVVTHVAQLFDHQWQQRRRVIDTLLLILFIFRLVFSKNKQGYGSTITELWEQCRQMRVPLPQSKPVVPSALAVARSKLDEGVFKTLHHEIIKSYHPNPAETQWKQHRLFAVDGTKMNLPRPLCRYGFPQPNKKSYYPQGLVSCLYELKSKIPTDFDLFKHMNERTAARQHLAVLRPDDIVVYDRGYFSYALLYWHHQRGIQAIFRLQTKKTFKPITDFAQGHHPEAVVEIYPSKARRREINKQYPDIDIKPLSLRLINYVNDDVTYTLGTTLLDSHRYPRHDFADLYHARWGIEELYKISKCLIEVDDFHGQTARGVRQELFAHFVLITLGRIFSNHAEGQFELTQSSTQEHTMKANMKNSLTVLARHIEALFLQQSKFIKETVHVIMSSIRTCRQKQRPNRSYERRSRKPIAKWQRTTKAKKTMPTQVVAA